MATDLGQLIYTLTLEDTGFQGQLSSASEKVKSSSGQMTGAMKETEEQSGKTGSAFSGMAGQFVAGQAIFTIAQKGLETLKNSIKDGIKNFEQWQINQAQINNSLKTTADASGQTTKSLNEYADALSSQTAISGNAINSAQLVLLNYKAIGKDIFPQTTKAVADFATVLSHGAVPSQDEMNAAAKKLGTALSDPEHGMARLKIAGIVLNDQQKAQIKTMQESGNLLGAQKLLLSDVSEVIGGKAATASHTLAGEQAQLHAQIEKVQIMVGQKLTQAFRDIEPYLAKFADWIMHHKPILEALAVTLGILAVVIAGAMVVAIISAVAGFIALSAAMLPVIGIAIAVGIVAVLIMNYWKDLKQWFNDFINDVKRWFTDGLNFIKEHWLLIVSILLGPLGFVVGEIIRNWAVIKNTFNDAVNFIKSVWSSIVGFFSSIISNVRNAIVNGVSGFGSLLFNAGKNIIQGLINGIDNMAGAVTSKVSSLGKDIENTAKKILKIFSPSQVFSDIGANVALGLAGGISDTSHHAIEATQQMTSSVIQAGVTVPAGVNNSNTTSSSVTGPTYNFGPGSVTLSTPEAVDRFFSIGNRNIALELAGGSPLAGTAGV